MCSMMLHNLGLIGFVLYKFQLFEALSIEKVVGVNIDEPIKPYHSTRQST